uniref:ORF104 n=1 Tax=Malaco herpesvirus 1 TaxID=3031797 RepID=A0AA48P7U8_9VIRU|nr:TPA_asm: ORF104 [Malaco herpesvirus 1]
MTVRFDCVPPVVYIVNTGLRPVSPLCVLQDSTKLTMLSANYVNTLMMNAICRAPNNIVDMSDLSKLSIDQVSGDDLEKVRAASNYLQLILSCNESYDTPEPPVESVPVEPVAEPAVESVPVEPVPEPAPVEPVPEPAVVPDVTAPDSEREQSIVSLLEQMSEEFTETPVTKESFIDEFEPVDFNTEYKFESSVTPAAAEPETCDLPDELLMPTSSSSIPEPVSEAEPNSITTALDNVTDLLSEACAACEFTMDCTPEPVTESREYESVPEVNYDSELVDELAAFMSEPEPEPAMSVVVRDHKADRAEKRKHEQFARDEKRKAEAKSACERPMAATPELSEARKNALKGRRVIDTLRDDLRSGVVSSDWVSYAKSKNTVRHEPVYAPVSCVSDEALTLLSQVDLSYEEQLNENKVYSNAVHRTKKTYTVGAILSDVTVARVLRNMYLVTKNKNTPSRCPSDVNQADFDKEAKASGIRIMTRLINNNSKGTCAICACDFREDITETGEWKYIHAYDCKKQTQVCSRCFQLDYFARGLYTNGTLCASKHCLRCQTTCEVPSLKRKKQCVKACCM